MEEVVKVQCLKHQYSDKTEVSVCGLDFTVNRGEKIALIGANGSGKTTLLWHILGLLKPTEGKVEVFGADPTKDFSPKVGMVLQNVEDQLIGPTVKDDIAFSLVNYGLEDIEQKVKQAMKDLELELLENKVIHYLSGGEKKRVALAGALVLRPELLVLDEPLAELDPATLDLCLAKINQINRECKTAVVMAINDLALVEKFADVVYLIENGNIVFKGTFKELQDSDKKYEICHH